MPEDEVGPAVRRRQLGRQLRDFRLAAGYRKIQEAADATGLSRASISRIESAKQAILPRTVRLLCQAYGIGAPMLDHMLRLAEESDDRGWLVEYSATVPNWFERYLGEEADARRIWTYEAEFVPGLFQTADYCRAVSATSGPDVSEDNLRNLIALRQARQKRLSAKNPPVVTAVINEAVLHRVVGGPEVMRAQLTHLADMATRPNITIQVLPFTAGAHPAMTGSFSMLHFPPGTGEPTVFVEVDSGALYPDRRLDFERYEWIFHRLNELALSPDETSNRISRLIGEQDLGD